MFDTVAIWGVGLLGGSLGLALRERRLARRIIGVGRSPERVAEARRLGTCDEATTDPAEGFAEADLAVLCPPVKTLAHSLPRIAPLFKENALITDVGSTKARIVSAAQAAFPPGRQFVGSHPMAGGTDTGVAAARADLFDGRACFVTPTEKSDAGAVSRVKAFWEALGMRVIQCDPGRHDAVVAAISHAPHLAAAAITMAAAARDPDLRFLAGAAGPGFWDATRLAKGDVTMWTEICQENNEEIDRCLGQIVDQIEEARRHIARGGQIAQWLEKGAKTRWHMEQLGGRPDAASVFEE